jgi:polysaccharide pyruvyl transferase WcaK-like protein
LRSLTRKFDVKVFGFGAMYGDPELARAIAEMGTEASIVTISQWPDQQLFDFFSSLDVAIVSRLHACVLAFASGVPFFAIDPYWTDGEATKLSQFTRDIGFPEKHFGIDRFLQLGGDLIDWIEASVSDEKERLSASYETASRKCSDHFDFLAKFFLGSMRGGGL